MSSNLKIRKIEKKDNAGVETLIKTVMPEFGADGPGFAIHDPEVLDMYSAYHKPGHVYFVLTDGDRILGGGGIAPLNGMEETCELQKMYFLKEARGLGLGEKIMDHCLEFARNYGYKTCYIETLKSMVGAQKLYLKKGFVPLLKPLGNTGHFSCDLFFSKDLLGPA